MKSFRIGFMSLFFLCANSSFNSRLALAESLLTPQTPSSSSAEQAAKEKAASSVPVSRKAKRKLPQRVAQAVPVVGPSATPVATPQSTPSDLVVRTPAKRYGSAYSIKITLSREGFTYDVPVWVKPDQKESTLDRDQLADLGWVYKDVKPEDITMSGETLDVPVFKNLKTEWAYVPDFSRSCCYGVIGQDILKHYEVRFDPTPPVHLEWIKLTAEEEAPRKTRSTLQKELPRLFTIRSTHGTFGKQKINLDRTPYRLNLAKGELNFEPEWKDPKAATSPLSSPIFQYDFLPPVRQIVVLSIPQAYQKSAHSVRFKAQLKITHLNNVLAGALDRFEVLDYLTGRKSKKLLIKTEKSIITFDFEKNEFTQSEAIQSTPGRN